MRNTSISVLCVSALCLLGIGGCSTPQALNRVPPLTSAFFDVRYVLQIETRRDLPEFRFEEGDIVEFEGLLIYHGNPPGELQEILPDATWFGSLYPNGEWLGGEQLRIWLRSPDNAVQERIDWLVDNDDFLLVLGNSLPPPHIITSGELCVFLRVAELSWLVEEDSSFLLLQLVPAGAEDGGLVRSDLNLCR